MTHVLWDAVDSGVSFVVEWNCGMERIAKVAVKRPLGAVDTAMHRQLTDILDILRDFE